MKCSLCQLEQTAEMAISPKNQPPSQLLRQAEPNNENGQGRQMPTPLSLHCHCQGVSSFSFHLCYVDATLTSVGTSMASRKRHTRHTDVVLCGCCADVAVKDRGPCAAVDIDCNDLSCCVDVGTFRPGGRFEFLLTHFLLAQTPHACCTHRNHRFWPNKIPREIFENGRSGTSV